VGRKDLVVMGAERERGHLGGCGEGKENGELGMALDVGDGD
jgi:hypothetical protein